MGDDPIGLLRMVKGNIRKPYLKDIHVPAVLNFHIVDAFLGIYTPPWSPGLSLLYYSQDMAIIQVGMKNCPGGIVSKEI